MFKGQNSQFLESLPPSVEKYDSRNFMPTHVMLEGCGPWAISCIPLCYGIGIQAFVLIFVFMWMHLHIHILMWMMAEHLIEYFWPYFCARVWHWFHSMDHLSSSPKSEILPYICRTISIYCDQKYKSLQYPYMSKRENWK